MCTRPRTTLILPTALLAFLALFTMAAASRAEAGEVHFDPESPAGKEYALPLQQARNEALGGGGESTPGGGGSAGAATPLFGVGVGGEGGGSGPGGGTARPGGESKPEGGDEGAQSGRSGDLPESDSGSARAGAAATASYSEGEGLLLLAGILTLGAAIGLGLRAFGRQRPAAS